MFWVASIASFLVSLDSTMLFAAFEALRGAFPGVSPAGLSWVLNAYTAVYAAMLIPSGGRADTHGRKRIFMLGVTVFLAASAACGLAGSVEWLIAARVLQAVGAALLTPASLSIVLALCPQSKRAVAVSLWGAGWPGWPPPWGRISARSWSTASAGSGRPSSTCRWAGWRYGAGRRCSPSRPGPRRAARSMAWAWCCSS